MNSTTYTSITSINSILIPNLQNLSWTNQSKIEDNKIDDFENVFDSIEIKILWVLSWIVFESFTNAYHFFIIIFEKFEG